MKNSPLKNKIQNWIKNEDYDGKAPIIRIYDDVKSATEFLKQLLGGECDSEIEEAFIDIYKK